MSLVIAFDYDGTLVDSNLSKNEGFLSFAGKHKGALGETIMTQLTSQPGIGDRYSILEEYCHLTDSDHEKAILLPWLEREIFDRTVNCQEILGAKTTLDYLRSICVPVFINSATPQEPLSKLLEARGWTSFFNGVYGGQYNKAETLKLIEAGVPRSDLRKVMVGDSQDDFEGALLAGWDFVSVVRESGRIRSETKFSVTDMRELLVLLKQLT